MLLLRVLRASGVLFGVEGVTRVPSCAAAAELLNAREGAVALEAMGHEVVPEVSSNGFGREQIIWRTEDGSLVGATEPRTDGCVAAW